MLSVVTKMKKLQAIICVAIVGLAFGVSQVCMGAEAGSRDSIKFLPDGAQVSINGIIVSASFSNNGFFYAEKLDRSFGIWVYSSDYVVDGDVYNITGTMGTSGGERVLVASYMAYQGMGSCPRPAEIGMSNKSLGGGAMQPFTPAVADSAGPNNTGLLVRTWGTVTFVDKTNRVYYINDGSNVAADNNHTGVKVYMMQSAALPSVGDFMTVSGVSCAETPEGSQNSIRALFEVSPVTKNTATDRGTASGTITATGASGRTAKIYSHNASTQVTFAGNTASYNLSLPVGVNFVTFSIPGYMTQTHQITVNKNADTKNNYTFSALQKVIDVYSIPTYILPNGTSTVTVTAIVRDEEGRRCANESITWSSNKGTVVSSDSVTDAVGEAHMVLRSDTTPGTATVTAASGAVIGTGNVDFCSGYSPSISMLQPAAGSTVGGLVEILLDFSDTFGPRPGVSMLTVYVDGQEITSRPADINDVWWYSNKVSNGSHTIKASVTDNDGNVTSLGPVTVNVQNSISELSVSPEQVVANQAVQISAKLTPSSAWNVTIKDVAGNQVFARSGTGSTVSATWPGTAANGLYTVSVTNGTDTCTRYVAANIATSPTVVAIGEDDTFRYYGKLLNKVAAKANQKGLSYNILLADYATWDNVKALVSDTNCHDLYISCGGNYRTPYLSGDVTHLFFKKSKSVMYAQNWDGCPASGSNDPNYNGWKIVYASELGRSSYPLRFAYIDASYSGRVSAYRSTSTSDILYGKYGEASCYENTGYYNDLAYALGINSTSSARGYVGYYDKCWSGDRRYDGSGDYVGIVDVTWDTLADRNYGFEFIRRNRVPAFSNLMTPSTDITPSGPTPDALIAPYYNWRFWGNEKSIVLIY